MFCRKCEKEIIVKEAEFCPKCGTALDSFEGEENSSSSSELLKEATTAEKNMKQCPYSKEVVPCEPCPSVCKTCLRYKNLDIVSSEKGILCHKCGKEIIVEGSEFCHKCGVALTNYSTPYSLEKVTSKTTTTSKTPITILSIFIIICLTFFLLFSHIVSDDSRTIVFPKLHPTFRHTFVYVPNLIKEYEDNGYEDGNHYRYSLLNISDDDKALFNELEKRGFLHSTSGF
ncbi:MAG: zinc-ribbon domain-containing protein [bacterium]|nr:zinc-ribbon domain-containing protein [bacterium]